MRDLTRSLYNLLQADGNLPGLLGTYEGTTSIFTSTPVPETAGVPFVVVSGSVSDVDHGVKNAEVRRIVVDVSVYTDADGNVDLVEEIGDHLRTVLGGIYSYGNNIRHWTPVLSNARGPIVNDQEELYGRVISVEFLLYKKAG